jgi:DegV family protein with EDD domain
MAAEQIGPALVRVVDSRSAAMGLGFAVLAAAEAAAAGRGANEVYQAAVDTAERTTTLFYVDTLEHLRRGGRIGAAQALLGTALAVKPILHVADGRIVPLEKVRTMSKGIARLEALTLAAAGDGPADVAVHHLAAAERAAVLADRLRARLPRLGQFHTSEVGAVVGAHVGPGVLGVVVVRR